MTTPRRNFTDKEEHALVELVQVHGDILDLKTKQPKDLLVEMERQGRGKELAWQDIHKKMGERGYTRSVDAFKSKWCSLAQEAKKCHRNQRKEMFMTGGGMANPEMVNVPDLMLKVLDLIKPALEPCMSKFDSNAEHEPLTPLATPTERKEKRRKYEESLTIHDAIAQLETRAKILETQARDSKQKYRAEKASMKKELNDLREKALAIVSRKQIKQWVMQQPSEEESPVILTLL